MNILHIYVVSIIIVFIAYSIYILYINGNLGMGIALSLGWVILIPLFIYSKLIRKAAQKKYTKLTGETFISAGFYSSIGYSHKTLLWNYTRIMLMSNKRLREKYNHYVIEYKKGVN